MRFYVNIVVDAFKIRRKVEMQMLFVCYPKCSTCMKAKKWLEEKGMEYELRDIKAENPTAEEL